MLTAIDENKPMITFRPVKALYAVFMYVEVSCILPVTRGPPPFVTIYWWSALMILVEKSICIDTYHCPKEECEEGGRHNDAFDPEEDPQLLNRHNSKRCLCEPVKENA